MGTIVLKNVNKSFGTTQVIPGIDLTIIDGEFVVFDRAVGLRQVDIAAG